ncbi:hypothetical protein ACQY0O_004850 [Thecaphora frezii]
MKTGTLLVLAVSAGVSTLGLSAHAARVVSLQERSAEPPRPAAMQMFGREVDPPTHWLWAREPAEHFDETNTGVKLVDQNNNQCVIPHPPPNFSPVNLRGLCQSAVGFTFHCNPSSGTLEEFCNTHSSYKWIPAKQQSSYSVNSGDEEGDDDDEGGTDGDGSHRRKKGGEEEGY